MSDGNERRLNGSADVVEGVERESSRFARSVGPTTLVLTATR